MSDEEEIDLELLRSAALATIGKKQEAIENNETEDLDILRKMALTSRKKQKSSNETGIFEKLQPAKSSNLISLTSHLNHESKTSTPENINKSDLNSSSEFVEKENSVDDISSDTFSRNSSDVSSSSDAEESTNESEESSDDEQGSSVTKVKEPNEEDALLSAIDQFLDEGVIMLEKAADSAEKQPSSLKKTKKMKAKSKLKKTSKKKKKPEKTFVIISSKKKVTETKVEPSVKRKTSSELRQRKKSLADKQDILPQKHIKREETCWKAEDLPLRDKEKTRTNSDSVHSSDLSFLSNSDKSSEKADAKVERATHEAESSQQEVRYIRINKRKLDQLQRDQTQANRTIALEPSYNHIDDNGDVFPPTKRDVVPQRDRNLPDLREKLKRRGLHSRKSANRNARNHEQNHPDGDCDPSTLVKRIYVKPSIVHDSNGMSGGDSFSTVDVRKQKDRLIVTRKVAEDTFAPIKIRIDDEVEDDFKNFRRKRSVVPYDPEESASDKKKRLDMIKRKAEESLEAKSLSDLSDDFDDFEIEEPNENLSATKDHINRKTSLDPTNSETRRFISSSRRKALEVDARLSDYDENPDSESSRVRGGLRKDSDGVESDESDDGRTRVRSKVNLSAANDSKRQRVRRSDESYVARERTSTRRLGANSRSARDRNDRVRRCDSPKRRSSPPRDPPDFRRKRRINVASVDKAELKRSVKERLGLNRDKSRRNESRFSKDRHQIEIEDLSRKKADREKDVDERILRINQKNAEIKKRRKMIEMEEQQFRLKAS